MRTEKCKTCQNYTHVEDRSGREWMNSTGWCDLPRLSVKRRRVSEDSWCDQYSEAVPPQTNDLVQHLESLPEVKPRERYLCVHNNGSEVMIEGDADYIKSLGWTIGVNAFLMREVLE